MSIRFNLPRGAAAPTTRRATTGPSRLRLFTFGGGGGSDKLSTDDEALVAAALTAAAAVNPDKAHDAASSVEKDAATFFKTAKYDPERVRRVLTQMHAVQTGNAKAPDADAYTSYLARQSGAPTPLVASALATLEGMSDKDREAASADLAVYAASVAPAKVRDAAVNVGYNRSRLELVNDVSSPDAEENLRDAIDDLRQRVIALEQAKAARTAKVAKKSAKRRARKKAPRAP